MKRIIRLLWEGRFLEIRIGNVNSPDMSVRPAQEERIHAYISNSMIKGTGWQIPSIEIFCYVLVTEKNLKDQIKPKIMVFEPEIADAAASEQFRTLAYTYLYSVSLHRRISWKNQS